MTKTTAGVGGVQWAPEQLAWAERSRWLKISFVASGL